MRIDTYNRQVSMWIDTYIDNFKELVAVKKSTLFYMLNTNVILMSAYCV